MRVQRFSNPDGNWQGKPIGDSYNNVARTFSENLKQAASFFPAMDCQQDSDCDDNDTSTENTCNRSNGVCVFTPGSSGGGSSGGGETGGGGSGGGGGGSTGMKIVRIIKGEDALDGGSHGSNNQAITVAQLSNSVNQQWEEISRGDGYYSYQKVGTSFSIDGGDGGKNGQEVVLRPTSSGNENQQWRKVSVGDGKYNIIKRNAIFALNGGGDTLKMWSSNSPTRNNQFEIEDV